MRSINLQIKFFYVEYERLKSEWTINRAPTLSRSCSSPMITFTKWLNHQDLVFLLCLIKHLCAATCRVIVKVRQQKQIWGSEAWQKLIRYQIIKSAKLVQITDYKGNERVFTGRFCRRTKKKINLSQGTAPPHFFLLLSLSTKFMSIKTSLSHTASTTFSFLEIKTGPVVHSTSAMWPLWGPLQVPLFDLNNSFCSSRRVCSPSKNSDWSDIGGDHLAYNFVEKKSPTIVSLSVSFPQKMQSENIVTDVRSTRIFTWTTCSTRQTKWTILIKQ